MKLKDIDSGNLHRDSETILREIKLESLIEI